MALERLTESFRGKILKALPITESTQLIEASDGKKYKSRGAYEVEISRYNHENLNGRIYTKKLWENVISKQAEVWDGSVGLLDHPKDDAKQKDVFCVYHNMRIKESNSTVIADLFLVGTNGGDVKERLDAGGYIELSSSGLGEINSKDGKTVKEETFAIERPGDLVFNASQKVQFSKADEIVNETVNKDSLTTTDSIVEDVIEENKTGKLKEDNKMKIEERNFKLFMGTHLTETKKLTNLSEKIAKYDELLTFCEEDYAMDIKTGIIAELKEANQAFSELAKKGEKADSLKEEVEVATKENVSLAEQLATALLLAEDSKELATKFKGLYERESARSNTMISAEEFQEKMELIKDLEAKLVESEKEVVAEEVVAPKIYTGKVVVAESTKEVVLKAKLVENVEVVVDKVEKPYVGKDEYMENAPKLHQPSQEVLALYEDFFKCEPEVECIKDEILGCKTVSEAQLKKIKLKRVYQEFAKTNKTVAAPIEESVVDVEPVRFIEKKLNVCDAYVSKNGML